MNAVAGAKGCPYRLKSNAAAGTYVRSSDMVSSQLIFVVAPVLTSRSRAETPVEIDSLVAKKRSLAIRYQERL